MYLCATFVSTPIGLIIDYNSDIVKGIANSTINRLISDLRQQIADNVTLDTHIFSDFSDFENDIEDDPNTCKKLFYFVYIVYNLHVKRVS